MEPFLLSNFQTTFPSVFAPPAAQAVRKENILAKVTKGNKRIQERTRRHVGRESEVSNVQLSWMKVALLLEFVYSFPTWSRFIKLRSSGGFWGLKGTPFQSGGAMRDPTIWHDTICISQKLLYSKLLLYFKCFYMPDLLSFYILNSTAHSRA